MVRFPLTGSVCTVPREAPLVIDAVLLPTAARGGLPKRLKAIDR